MKNIIKIILSLSIIIMIVFTLACFIKDTSKNNFNNVNYVNDVNDVQLINKVETDDNNIISQKNNLMNTEKSSLPNDVGLTVNGVPKTFNQDIMAKANIAYLLGCENITDSTDLDEYINSHISNNGIFISNQTVYQKTDNPYDFVPERRDVMAKMLASINLQNNINEKNYLVEGSSSDELEKKINKVIVGDKKVIIGLVADYYTYINDTDYGLQLGGGFVDSSYVSFKPYNNIYAYIFDENSDDTDSFYDMMEEISKLAD